MTSSISTALGLDKYLRVCALSARAWCMCACVWVCGCARVRECALVCARESVSLWVGVLVHARASLCVCVHASASVGVSVAGEEGVYDCSIFIFHRKNVHE